MARSSYVYLVEWARHPETPLGAYTVKWEALRDIERWLNKNPGEIVYLERLRDGVLTEEDPAHTRYTLEDFQ